MKATPIAEFLALRDAEAHTGRQTISPNPFLARKASVSNDDSTPDFRRSGLGAALARRSPETPTLVRPLEANTLQRRSEPQQHFAPPPPEPEPVVNIEQQLAEAYHRGVQEGLDAGRSEAATARALERAEWQKRAVVEKLDFQMNEFARLSEMINTRFAELEQRTAQAVGRVLKPFLQEAVTKQILEELSQHIIRLTGTGGIDLLKISGPESLLCGLKDKITHLAVNVEYRETDDVELVVATQTTEIRSEIQPWASLIETLIESS